jgi:hypothetical protein
MQIMVKSFVVSLKAGVKFTHKILCLWLFVDVAYTVLPIATIAIINLALNDSFSNFLLIPEWSFASIVFYGLSIRYLIEIKVKDQKDLSYKLDTGTQIFILLMIASVISLSLVILSQKGLKLNIIFIEKTQLWLFVMGIFSLLLATLAKLEVGVTRIKLPDGMSKIKYYSYLEDSLNKVLGNLSYLKYALDKSNTIQLKSFNGYDNRSMWDQEKLRELEEIIKNIDQSSKEVNIAFAILKSNPPKST